MAIGNGTALDSVCEATLGWDLRRAAAGLLAAAGAAAGRRVRSGEYSLHVQSSVRLDDHARVWLARDDLRNIQPVRIVLELQTHGFHALPIDEVVAQPIVHRVQIGDADVAGELRRGFLRAVLHFQIGVQPPAQQRHGSALRDIRLDGRQVDVARLHAQIERQRLRRDVAVELQRSLVVDLGVERYAQRPRQIQAHSLDLQRQRRQQHFRGRRRAAVLGGYVRILQIEFGQVELPRRA